VGLQARALLEILRRRPQVIVCGHVLLGPWCRVVSVLLRVPYVAMAYAYEIRAPRMQAIARVALRGARRVVTISQFSRRAVEAHGIAPDKVSVIHPGAVVEGRAIESEPDDAEAAGARVLLSVGRLVDAYKGHDMVIRALPLILARVPGVRHVVVGFAGGPIPALPANLPLMKGAALLGVDVRQFPLFEPETAAACLTELLDWVADGRLVPPVGRVFALDQAREALTFALSGSGIGKTVLKVG